MGVLEVPVARAITILRIQNARHNHHLTAGLIAEWDAFAHLLSGDGRIGKYNNTALILNWLPHIIRCLARYCKGGLVPPLP
jgi:hypothetical protein